LLASGGVLAPFWNVRIEQTDAVALALVRLYKEIMPDVADAFMAPQGARRLESEDALRASPLFSDPVVECFEWQRTCTTSQYLDLIRTHSVYRLMSEDTRLRLLTGVAEILDAAGGRFTFGYETVLVLSHRQ